MFSLIRISVMLVVGLAIYIRLFENGLVFYPDKTVTNTPGVGFEHIQFAASDGIRLHGWYIPFDNSTRVFLVSHGNAGNIGDRAIMGDFLHREFRENVFMYDYRGYGQSEGQPSEAGLYSDIRGAVAYLRSSGFDSKSIYLIGQPLGTAVTVDFANQEPVGGIILEAPFPSVRAVARRFLLSVPLDYVMKARFDSIAKVNGIHAPIVVIHATADPVIPYDLGRTLFDALPGPKKLFTVPEVVHEGALMSLSASSIHEIRDFLRISDH